jgi:hypothetical protein
LNQIKIIPLSLSFSTSIIELKLLAPKYVIQGESMIPHFVSLIFFFPAIPVLEIATVSALIARPNCTEIYGSISIAFPSEKGNNCFMNN